MAARIVRTIAGVRHTLVLELPAVPAPGAHLVAVPGASDPLAVERVLLHARRPVCTPGVMPVALEVELSPEPEGREDAESHGWKAEPSAPTTIERTP